MILIYHFSVSLSLWVSPPYEWCERPQLLSSLIVVVLQSLFHYGVLPFCSPLCRFVSFLVTTRRICVCVGGLLNCSSSRSSLLRVLARTVIIREWSIVIVLFKIFSRMWSDFIPRTTINGFSPSFSTRKQSDNKEDQLSPQRNISVSLPLSPSRWRGSLYTATTNTSISPSSWLRNLIVCATECQKRTDTYCLLVASSSQFSRYKKRRTSRASIDISSVFFNYVSFIY